MPIQDVTRHSALGSHAPDLFETNENDTDRRTLQRNSFDGTYYLKRRNTFGDSGIGAAQASPTAQKRRSRSAGNLRQMAAPYRNRDDEINFWRKSMQDSPIFTHDPDRPATRDTSEDHDQPHVEAGDFHSDQVPDSSNDTPTLHLMPSQTFDFGNLVNINSEDTVEQRLTTVEIKLMDLEMAMARLSGHDVAKHLILDKAPAGRKSARQSKLTSVASSEAVDLTSIGSSQPSPNATESELAVPTLGDRLNRSSAATTVRPSTAVRRSAAESQVSERPPSYATIEHVEKLMILLQREQASRHRLELQVKGLVTQLDQLQRSPPYAHFKVNAYPTPSPEGRPVAPTAPTHTDVTSDSRQGPVPKFRDDASIQTDTDDGFLDVYQTPIEVKQHQFSMENLRAQQTHMGGMI